MSIEILYVSFYSYFLGSIPFGLVLTKLFLDKDLRNVGSGNIGATNVLRTGKKSLGALTLFLDGLKSYIVIIGPLSNLEGKNLVLSLISKGYKETKFILE